MARYMLSVQTTGSQEPRTPMTPEQRRQGFEKVAALEAEMNASHTQTRAASRFGASIGEWTLVCEDPDSSDDADATWRKGLDYVFERGQTWKTDYR